MDTHDDNELDTTESLAKDGVATGGTLEDENEVGGSGVYSSNVRAVSTRNEGRGKVLWRGLFIIAAGIDAVGPAAWAKLARSRLYDQRRKAAAKDPVWAEIEARRKTDNGTTIFLCDTLSFADYDSQSRIARAAIPEPRWMTVLEKGEGLRVGRVLGGVAWGLQRARRGWSDRDAWDVGHHLTRMTAGMLEHLAAHSHGWPEGEDFPTPLSWEEKLREVARDLRAWDSHDEALYEAWNTLAISATSSKEEIKAASDAMFLDDAERHARTQTALVWVATYLGSLWD